MQSSTSYFGTMFGEIVSYILIIVQHVATQSSLFIIVQVHSACFGCQPHPSPGAHKTVTTASGTGHISLCSYFPPTWPRVWPRWREVAVNLHNNKQSALCASHWTIINIDQRCTEP